MNRRGFLGAILAAGCAPAIVRAESLMRCSGIIIPTTEEVLAANWQGLLTPNMITREALKILENSLQFCVEVNRDCADEFKALNSMIAVRRPHRFEITS